MPPLPVRFITGSKPVDRARFTATGGNGATYPVRAYQIQDDSIANVFDHPSNDPGDWEYETTGERVVLRLGRGEYLIPDTDTVVLADGGP